MREKLLEADAEFVKQLERVQMAAAEKTLQYVLKYNE